VRHVAYAAAAVLLLAGCGGSVHRMGRVPPRDVSRQLATLLDPRAVTAPRRGCVPASVFAAGSIEPCSPGDSAVYMRETRRLLRELAPAKGQAPGVVSELPLARGDRELLVAWKATDGRVCMIPAHVDAGRLDEPFGLGDPFGPCMAPAARSSGVAGTWGDATRPCRLLCLEDWYSRLGFTLVGSADERATALRITVGGGAVKTVPLRGPLLAGTGSRIVMLELGKRSWRRIELIRGGTVVARRALPAMVGAQQDCVETYTAPVKVLACLRKADRIP